ncbi:MAG: hypothetical protein SPK09_06045 [Porphyromonas sp.]|nr:hypothetical protein [Porphyromonas sp.]
MNERQDGLTDAVLEALSGAGIEIVRATEADVEAVWGGGRANAELSRGQKEHLTPRRLQCRVISLSCQVLLEQKY